MRVNANPTKDFFVNMITRDITLTDCILDLLDNSIDGANKIIHANQNLNYSMFRVDVTLDEKHFSISDNCGGISIREATDYAFHFGKKRNDIFTEAEYGIGLYGIGMKRAIFKISLNANIFSKNKDDSFSVDVDVVEWLKNESWDFELTTLEWSEHNGTMIQCNSLTQEASISFADSVFINKLSRTIARDYSFFLQDGFSIFINGQKVSPYIYKFHIGNDFAPAVIKYSDDDVEVKIKAGLSTLIFEDDSLAEMQSSKSTEYFGWFVVCNNRIVLPADKSEKTGWGDEGSPKWHPQYNGFMGILFFNSKDPNKLPWTTTKRDINTSSPMYRRALSKMKEVTYKFVSYTTDRKINLVKARQAEQELSPRNLLDFTDVTPIKLPKIEKPQIKYSSVQYVVQADRLNAAKKAFGSPTMSNSAIGEQAFNYYYRNEVEED